MNRIFEQIYDVIADVLKLFVMAWFVIMILLYASLNIVAARAVSVAESKGVFLQADVRHYLDAFNIAESKVVINSWPVWGQSAKFLGEPIWIEIVYDLDIPMIHGTVPMEVAVKKLGINQFYPGESAYGSYDREGAGP